MVYGSFRDEARSKVQALALRVVTDRLEHSEARPALLSITYAAAWRSGATLARGRRRLRWCGLVGTSSDRPALTEHCLDRVHRIHTLRSTMLMKRALECGLGGECF